MWGPLAIPFAAAAVLLIVAGGPKLIDPIPLANALRSAGLTSGHAVARAIAAVEVVVGLAALAWPSRWTGVAVAVLYAGFTAFVLRALATGGMVESCGCFGKADTPPTRSHAAVTGLLALVGLATAVAPPGGSGPWAGSGAGELVAGATLTTLVAFLAWQVMAVLPTTTPASIRSIGRS